ncbi:selenium-dependent molybdenum cofactor biosynthesis protein YqeB [Geomonas azotofigens]|uniref:selenium-dependent molybdenum cofactor biosynthesis protein YqeB n=1 Tax=Geomonas azotofigens TaxID=2843196 RepID=UPI001C0FD3BD|nr:selenium-dependent molybdenum cofactor biosynthesis protein YqeB [Geomonas azotofigens]MBU5613843.1 EF2563 family selenium-dependent molybdenum hydroxylase system protein [Geomonas azotofigens]
MKERNELKIVIRGAGEIASGVAHVLYQADFRRVLMLERPAPLAVRRGVSFCEALHHASVTVEGVEAVSASTKFDIGEAWHAEQIPVLVDPKGKSVRRYPWDVFVDATLAKTNLGTRLDDAGLVIGLGPGFTAGVDCHAVIETNRGPDLGRIIQKGAAAADTGVPAEVGGYTVERVLRAPASGVFKSKRRIGQMVAQGERVGSVDGVDVVAGIAGLLRGLIMPGTRVQQGMKVGDIDPRGEAVSCDTISDKARTIGAGVLEAILSAYGR